MTTVGRRGHLARGLQLARAALLPAAAAAALWPLRETLSPANVALVLVAVMALSAPGSSWWPPSLTAASGALAYLGLWASPAGSLAVDRGADLLTAGLLAAIGLLVARLGQRWRSGRPTPTHGALRRARLALRRPRGVDCLRSVGRVSAEVACGDSASFVRLDVARTLVELLDLRDCRYEPAPYPPSTRPVLEHPGWLTLGAAGWSPFQVGLPARGFDIVAQARGVPIGRFVCIPRRGGRAREDGILAALALVDHAALASLIETAA